MFPLFQEQNYRKVQNPKLWHKLPISITIYAVLLQSAKASFLNEFAISVCGENVHFNLKTMFSSVHFPPCAHPYCRSLHSNGKRQHNLEVDQTLSASYKFQRTSSQDQHHRLKNACILAF